LGLLQARFQHRSDAAETQVMPPCER
jgi:hypothetical protein